MCEPGPNQKMKQHPFPKMIQIEKPERLPQALTAEDFEQFKKYVSKNFDQPYRLIVSLMLSTGARVHEVVKIKYEDIDLTQGRIRIFGKRSKDRIVSIEDKKLIRDIQNYLSENNITKGLLFPGRFDGKSLTKSAVWRKIHAAGEELGLPELHPHTLRHQFAIEYLIRGGNVKSLQELLGHKNLQTTSIYTKMHPEAVMNVAKKHAPFVSL
jgi:integrase/recombinase XerD